MVLKQSSRIHATIYPDAGIVHIIDESLWRPGAKLTNIAKVIASDYVLKSVESSCLSVH
jgi:hypothetical protein